MLRVNPIERRLILPGWSEGYVGYWELRPDHVCLVFAGKWWRESSGYGKMTWIFLLVAVGLIAKNMNVKQALFLRIEVEMSLKSGRSGDLLRIMHLQPRDIPESRPEGGSPVSSSMSGALIDSRKQ
jgi:hypothetical protein